MVLITSGGFHLDLGLSQQEQVCIQFALLCDVFTLLWCVNFSSSSGSSVPSRWASVKLWPFIAAKCISRNAFPRRG